LSALAALTSLCGSPLAVDPSAPVVDVPVVPLVLGVVEDCVLPEMLPLVFGVVLPVAVAELCDCASGVTFPLVVAEPDGVEAVAEVEGVPPLEAVAEVDGVLLVVVVVVVVELVCADGFALDSLPVVLGAVPALCELCPDTLLVLDDAVVPAPLVPAADFSTFR